MALPANGTELIVVRHGETLWNAENRFQGHDDSELSDLGRRQSEALAARFVHEHIDAIYSSDLGRALSTAEKIAGTLELELDEDRRLRERKLGIFEGLTWDQIHRKFPNEAADYRTGDPDYVIPEGESRRQHHTRVVACLQSLVQKHPDRRIIIVTHGGVLDLTLRFVLQIPLTEPRHWKLYNASTNTFFFENTAWTLGTWGDISHLHEAGSLDDY